MHTVSLDKLHGNVTIFRLLSTHIARRFYGRAWKACSCCMIVNHGRVAAALGWLVVCLTCCMICCPAHAATAALAAMAAMGAVVLAIYDSPRGVCAIYEYFRKSNLSSTARAPRAAVFAHNYMEQRELRIQYAVNRHWELSQLSPFALATRQSPTDEVSKCP